MNNIAINTTVLRILYSERGMDDKTFANKCEETLDEVYAWMAGDKDPTSRQFDIICEVLGVAPEILLLDSNDLIAQGKDTRVVRFYTRELLGRNKEPIYTEIKQIEEAIQYAASIEDSATTAKSGTFTIFNTEQPSDDTESDTTGSDEVS